jgi:FtsP/CotA-like multicopper oxidase with cupredoxin domain
MESISCLPRRRFLQLAGLGLFASGLPRWAGAMSASSLNQASPLFHPDLEIEMVSRNVAVPLLPGAPTRVSKYFAKVIQGPAGSVVDIPGSYLGPLLRFRQGQKVRIYYRNEMDSPSIAHWHGLHVSHLADGHPMYAVHRGETYVYEFEVKNRAGTYIYHSHAHEETAEQVYQGLASGILVSDDEEQKLGLPSGEYDLPVVLQDRAFDASNQLVYVSHPMERMTGFHGDRILLNGTANTRFDVASRAYRLRLVNASNARIYKLAWDDGTPLTVIGCDGGLLEKPEVKPYVMLAPGERVDLWADFSGRKVGSELVMRSKPFHGVLPAMAERMLGRQGGGGMGHGMMGGMGGGMNHGGKESGGHSMGMGGMGGGMGHGMMGGMGGGMNHGGNESGGRGMGGMMNMPHFNLPVGSDYPVFSIRVTRQMSDSPKLPTQLSTIRRYRDSDAANPGKPIPVGISEGHMSMLLNGRPYKMDDVQDFEKVKVDTVQMLEIFHAHGGSGGHGAAAAGGEHGAEEAGRESAMQDMAQHGSGGQGGMGMGGGMMGGGMGAMMSMAHPIHLHGQQFQVLRRQVDDGEGQGYASVREGFINSGWKDTVLVMPGEKVTIIKPFQDYTGLFMYHCHNLEHEDMGMMREFLIVK